MKIDKFRYEIKHLLDYFMQNFRPILASILLLTSCSVGERWSKNIKKINNYEKLSLNLARENRLLKVKINNLENEIQKLKLKKKYSSISKFKGPSRTISSISRERDHVRFKEYHWTAEELLFVAEIEYERNDYEKAAQFYNALIVNYPKFSRINDKLIFDAAISSYESKNHYRWANKYFNKLIKNYPNSHYYLSSKLWGALTLNKLGKRARFRSKLEEFKELYRNTPEWKVLSKHYEKIRKK